MLTYHFYPLSNPVKPMVYVSAKIMQFAFRMFENEKQLTQINGKGRIENEGLKFKVQYWGQSENPVVNIG